MYSLFKCLCGHCGSVFKMLDSEYEGSRFNPSRCHSEIAPFGKVLTLMCPLHPGVMGTWLLVGFKCVMYCDYPLVCSQRELRPIMCEKVLKPRPGDTDTIGIKDIIECFIMVLNY